MKNEIKLKEMNGIQDIYNMFVISDHHFYHHTSAERNIIKYCKRPFKDLQEMHYVMIRSWNAVVGKNDTVLHLGDLSFGNKKMVFDIRKKLNGKIYMVKGNHDKHGVKWYSDCGITLIKKPFTENNILFSHARKEDDADNINIHGHSHNKIPLFENINDVKFYNVSVENINYTPIRIGDLLKKGKKL